MEALTTPVAVETAPVRVSREQPLLLVGSCFSDEMGLRMEAAGMEVASNPFGTLYNPLSIAECLERALDNRPIGPDQLVFRDGLWHSWLHHTRFSHPDRQVCLDRCNQAIRSAHDLLGRQPLLLCTFGTAYAFYLNDKEGRPTASVAANCHKAPAAWFTRRRLTVEEIVTRWQRLSSKLSAAGVNTILTVSPIRHLADTAHGNQLSKAVLLLACERLVEQGCAAAYFPAYEILLDELRDYRFYTRDLCHPSDLAADIIWERFQNAFMDETERQECRRRERASRRSRHHPIANEQ